MQDPSAPPSGWYLTWSNAWRITDGIVVSLVELSFAWQRVTADERTYFCFTAGLLGLGVCVEYLGQQQCGVSRGSE